MMNLRSIRTGVSLAVLAAILSGTAADVHAQRRYTPADLRSGKVTFQQFSNQRAHRSMQHAYDYARDVQAYAPVVTQTQPRILQSEAEQIGQNIQRAQEQVVVARKQAADNKEAQAAYDAVQKHLETAAQAHQELHAECHKDAANPEVCAACCDRIAQALEKAMTEHEAIMKKLAPPAQTPATSPAPATAPKN